jgi:hypothetical protein
MSSPNLQNPKAFVRLQKHRSFTNGKAELTLFGAVNAFDQDRMSLLDLTDALMKIQ